jgi:hypothetical protein
MQMCSDSLLACDRGDVENAAILLALHMRYYRAIAIEQAIQVTSITLRQASTRYSQVLTFGPVIPALATNMSIFPSAEAVVSIARAT